ncbi:Membrane protein [Vibrio jasicida]|uniref:Membrane protein n=1 Tax=Vibrio jasicida TaxID=766224 RepID=A0AAU9QVP4_9VIBR|nr:hypothetical protein [Vibrio campbellii]MCE7732602.1 hypothetical protein [Vibrio campbellii]CAH1584166.1 Membrane protein [Vibrio jasicida]CAH1602987.1 Membrane protein [Vibrio jasicida]
MFNLFRFIFISNIVALSVVASIEKSIGLFGIKHTSDYAFFTAMVLWFIAALFFIYPPLGGMGQSSDQASRLADSMVDRTAVDGIDSERFSENVIFCLRLLISGAPTLVICVILDTYFMSTLLIK